MKKVMYIRKMAIMLLTICLFAEPGTVNAMSISNSFANTMEMGTYQDGLYEIMGTTSTTLSQMINYYTENAHYPEFYGGSDAPNIYVFCSIYIEECASEGIRAEVAFAQAMKETGFLRYGGDVSITQFNFAGIGASGGGNPGNSFSTVRMGIRAQVQHLKAYATSASLNHKVVDPRYQYVHKGSAPYVQWLGKYENPSGIGWATAKGYGYSIVNDYIVRLMGSSSYSTWYQGIDYSAVYDPNYYMQNNQDVASVAGGSSDGLINHFITYGMNEGRRGCVDFDVRSYKARYIDLRYAYGNDLMAYYKHYMTWGKREGRTAVGAVNTVMGITIYNGVDYSSVYDYNYYITKYPDIKAAFGTDDIAVLEHFINSGMREGRQGSANFEVNSYYNQYQDLRLAYGENLPLYYMHYISAGRREKRNAIGIISLQSPVTIYNGVDYSAVYDYTYYLNHNSDLYNAFGTNDVALLAHFVNNGILEGRQGNKFFNVFSYYNQYQDLRNAFGRNFQQYYLHYINNGCKEGRNAVGVSVLQNPTTVYAGVNYAGVYNYNYYCRNNPDVVAALGTDENIVLEHFVTYGMQEGRQASEVFNVHTYASNYQDLSTCFQSDWKSYYIHYLNYGRSEQRIAN